MKNLRLILVLTVAIPLMSACTGANNPVGQVIVATTFTPTVPTSTSTSTPEPTVTITPTHTSTTTETPKPTLTSTATFTPTPEGLQLPRTKGGILLVEENFDQRLHPYYHGKVWEKTVEGWVYKVTEHVYAIVEPSVVGPDATTFIIKLVSYGVETKYLVTVKYRNLIIAFEMADVNSNTYSYYPDGSTFVKREATATSEFGTSRWVYMFIMPTLGQVSISERTKEKCRMKRTDINPSYKFWFQEPEELAYGWDWQDQICLDPDLVKISIMK